MKIETVSEVKKFGIMIFKYDGKYYFDDSSAIAVYIHRDIVEVYTPEDNVVMFNFRTLKLRTNRKIRHSLINDINYFKRNNYTKDCDIYYIGDSETDVVEFIIKHGMWGCYDYTTSI